MTTVHFHNELSTTYSMYGLPQELIDEIVYQLRHDRRSLLCLSLVSTSFQMAAQAHLFQRITFVSESKMIGLGYRYCGDGSEDEQFHWVLPSNRVHTLLSILSVRSHYFVATLVRDLSLTLSESKSDTNDITGDLHHALQQMVNLECLRIMLGPLTGVCMTVILADLPCQLTRLCLLDKREYGDCENNTYATFISSQRRLEYFHLGSSLLVPCSLPFHCSTLETFIVAPTQSFNISLSLPRVTSLGLVDSPWSAPLPPSSLALMSSTLSQVRVLTFYSCFFKKPVLEKLFIYMPSLETLEIALDERSTTNRMTKHAILMLDYIHMLPRLRRFIWRVLSEKHYQRQSSMLTRDIQEARTKYWFSSLTDFREAYFAISPETDTYWCWTRGKSEPDEVSSVCFRGYTPFDDIVLDLYLAG